METIYYVTPPQKEKILAHDGLEEQQAACRQWKKWSTGRNNLAQSKYS